MANAPRRNKRVIFVGAGVGAAFGLPTTHELLDVVAHEGPGASAIAEELDEAYRYFYPVESSGAPGFRPNVVDFFSLLQAHIDLVYSEGGRFRAGSELPARALELCLRRAIANVLGSRIGRKKLKNRLAERSEDLDEILKPGNIVIMANWDVLLELYASIHGIRMRFQLPAASTDDVTLLKLHGGIDWGFRKDVRRAKGQFAPLRERLAPNAKRLALRSPNEIVRWRSVTSLLKRGRSASRGFHSPLMITMYPGKAAKLGPLLEIWDDAYRAISGAQDLAFLGYSLPPDDPQIRSLIVSGIRRGPKEPDPITVRNPSPEVHYRFRELISREARCDYTAIVAGAS